MLTIKPRRLVDVWLYARCPLSHIFGITGAQYASLVVHNNNITGNSKFPKTYIFHKYIFQFHYFSLSMQVSSVIVSSIGFIHCFRRPLSLYYKALDLSLITHSIYRTSKTRSCLTFHVYGCELNIGCQSSREKYVSGQSSLLMGKSALERTYSKFPDALNAKIHVHVKPCV